MTRIDVRLYRFSFKDIADLKEYQTERKYIFYQKEGDQNYVQVRSKNVIVSNSETVITIAQSLPDRFRIETTCSLEELFKVIFYYKNHTK